MNIENQPEEVIKLTLGQRLKEAREKRGMSQQDVAEKQCLRIAVIRDIEADNNSQHVSDVFWRGYIRAYAKQVQISDDELSAYLSNNSHIAANKTSGMRNFSQKESIKKRDKWLTILTCIILLLVLSLTGVWWWQKHQDQQQALAMLMEQTEPFIIPERSDSASASQITTVMPESALSVTTPAEPVAGPPASESVLVTQQGSAVSQSTQSTQSIPATRTMETFTATTLAVLTVTFINDCWLEIADAESGRVLFSGLKKKGEQLNFNDQISYRFKIGAPAAVEIQHKNKPVDLSQFIRERKVARFTLDVNS